MKSDQSKKTIIHFTPSAISFRNQLDRRLQLFNDAGWVNVGFSTITNLENEIFQRTYLRFVPSKHLTRTITVLKDLCYLFECAYLIRQIRPEVIITYGIKPSLYARLAAAACRVPNRFHVSWGLYFEDKSSLLTRYSVIALDYVFSFFSTVVFSQNRYDWDIMQHYPLQKATKFIHQGQGVDIDNRYNPANYISHRSEIRLEFDIVENKTYFFIAARITNEKGYPELLRAFHNLGKSCTKPMELLICGANNQPRSNTCQSMIPPIGQSVQNVRYLGTLSPDAVARLLSVVNCFVLPSHREGFPRSIVEAMSMGLPVITTNTRGCNEAIIDGYNGLIVPVADETELANAIRSMLISPESRTIFGQRSRKLALERHSEDEIINKMISNIRTV